MKKITENRYSSDSINVKQLILLIYCLYTRGKNVIFCQLCCSVLLLISHLCFDSEPFITFLVGLLWRGGGQQGGNVFFLFGRFIACISTYLHVKYKSNLSGEVCKIGEPPSLPIKKRNYENNLTKQLETLANRNPKKHWQIVDTLREKTKKKQALTYLQMIGTHILETY